MKGMIRSMKGEMIDMAALAAQNSNVVALGNARMNARGDIVNKAGKVLKAREVVVREYYNANPKAVTQTVSLRDLSDEIATLTPKQAVAAVDKVAAEQEAEPKKAEAPKKRKVILDDED